MSKQTVCFTLDTEADRDLARWLGQFGRGERSSAIRDTLRAGLGGGVTLGDVYQVVKGIERKMAAGAVVVPDSSDAPPVEEPPEAAAALDALAAMGS